MITLRPYQQESADKAVEFLRTTVGKSGLIVLPTGSGKSLVIAEVCKQLAAPTLVFQPSKEILQQNAAKYRSYGFGCGIYSASAGQKNMRDVTFATVGSVYKKLPLLSRFKYVIVDECFPAGTTIDGRPIEDIRPGDEVNSFNHYTERVERRKVVRLFKHKRNADLVKVTLTNGASFICTYNHPVHTVEDGYVPAGFLTNETVLFKHGQTATEKELRPLREGLQPDHQIQATGILLEAVQRCVPDSEALQSRGPLPSLRHTDGFDRTQSIQLPQNRQGLLQQRMSQAASVEGREADNREPSAVGATYASKKSNVDARREGEDDCIQQGQNVPFARGEWIAHETSDDATLSNGIANGARDRNCGSEGCAPVAAEPLQGGSCGPGCEAGNRGGRRIASPAEMEVPGQTEDGCLERVRVAGVEVHQSAGGARDGEMREDDTVYNFEVEGNHNYFANGVLVHNCHLVNSKGGMYEEVLSHMAVPVLGLTATPYRLGRDIDGRSILKFLTRTRPRVFDTVIHYVQCRDLFDAGYLSPMVYHEIKTINRAALQRNSTGADYTDASVREQYRQSGFHHKLSRVVNRLFEIGRRNAIVFTRFTDEARWLVQQIPGSAIVTAETPDRERDRIINGFRLGRIRCVANVGILTTGFDYPELESVVVARPTMSLGLWYQMVGRGVRICEEKKNCMVVDMCGNLTTFGRVEHLHLSAEGGWHISSNGRQLTNVPFGRAFRPQPQVA